MFLLPNCVSGLLNHLMIGGHLLRFGFLHHGSRLLKGETAIGTIFDAKDEHITYIDMAIRLAPTENGYYVIFFSGKNLRHECFVHMYHNDEKREDETIANLYRSAEYAFDYASIDE